MNRDAGSYQLSHTWDQVISRSRAPSSYIVSTALRQIRSVRRSLPCHALLTLVRALIVRKVDYCNSVLTGMSRHLHDWLQSVLNAAAHLVFSARRNDHIIPLLRDLQWLRVPERIKFRLCVLVYRCLHGMATSYLADDLHWLLLLVPAVNSGLLTLRLWWSGLPDARRSATTHFPWQLHAPRTASHQLLGTRRHFFHSGATWRHGCLNWHWLDTDSILRLHFISFLPMRF